tara:strand:- start:3942 stop:4571 length:630 start_codon:yes stop_codon:yes gene_type:complete
MKIKDIESSIGTLSAPSKMPCYSFSISAKLCITGQKLRKVKNSICSKCYALKGRYVFPNVQDALAKRFAGMSDPQWIDKMVLMINKREKSGVFRWHDSGDLQSVKHLAAIVEIAERLPDIRFWLPTREFSFVSDFMESNSVPANLTIRLSALMFDGKPPVGIAKRLGLVTSGASSGNDFTCPSSKQGGKCMDCRACWDKSVSNVNYKQH